MKLITSNSHQCMLASFAMYMGRTMEDLIELLGHDGKGRISQLLPEPYCYRSFHPQEFVDLFHNTGMTLMIVEKRPCMRHGQTLIDHTYQLGTERFYDYLQLYSGVLCGHISGSGHAVAYSQPERKIYDPRGYVYGLNDAYDRGLAIQYFLTAFRRGENGNLQ